MVTSAVTRDGSTIDVSNTTTWSMTNPFVVSIDTMGTVTLARSGYMGVSATGGTQWSTHSIQVSAEFRLLFMRD